MRLLVAGLVSIAVLLCGFGGGGVYGVDNGLGHKPNLGWNTWCTEGTCGRDVCTELEIQSVATAMIENGMRDAGYVWISLDDCWGGVRAADGSYQPDPQRFPSGMKALADWLHARGFFLGVYTDSGIYTCSSGGREYKIPGSYGHYEQDAQTFASWGVDLVKMDWCNTNVNGTQLDPYVQYPQMSAALNATGRAIWFTACEWGVDSPWEWIGPYVNDYRTTDDHHDAWIESDHGTATIIEANADLASYAGPGHWNFLDFIYTGGQGCSDARPGHRCPGQTNDEYITEFSIWTIVASSLILAADPRNMTDFQRSVLLNEEMLAVHQDDAVTAGGRKGYTQCGAAYGFACQVWARPLTGGEYAIALYNADSVAHDMTVNFELVDFSWKGATAVLRDLWAHADLGSFTGSYTAKGVPSHGTAVVRARVA